ncbi:uracil-DNA glycosylase [Lactobacillus ultunensis]|uniref:Uracil-DNA glycosylase, family 4 n=1 Tax=Lactobacillus ultunensis DSM 16047 TaxID=525365 RepID=C2EKE9_9LACO|nr:uracil-DNA glycosylase [Lactobacillus ultunensis]EEJ73028.1 uracil-DNA glycosylase, family 4 [Lactobacillus ultunensis DSM 16047]KRL81692.1 uracil-DNA glycosylase [Lactobacillus ultunensis DSM 16047]QQP29320.1 uracil-DNA glycosylase [Lactobacillus ultunensis]
MDYPKKLINEVRQRSKGMKLEGINSGSGPRYPLLMIVGEAPGRNEIVNNIPFSGDAGKELDKSLKQIGLTRDQVYITSAVRSRPYSIKKVFSKRENKEVTKYPNRKPTKKEILAHAPFLDYEIAYAQPKLIVALGNTGLERLIGPGHKISAEHGKVIKNTSILKLNKQKDGYIWSEEKYTIFPEYHPAAVFYNRKLAKDIKKDWEVIKPFILKEEKYE